MEDQLRKLIPSPHGGKYFKLPRRHETVVLTLEPRNVQFWGVDGHGVSLQAAVAPSTLGNHGCNRRQNSGFLEPTEVKEAFAAVDIFTQRANNGRALIPTMPLRNQRGIKLAVVASSSGGLQLYKEGAHEDTFIRHLKGLCKLSQNCMKVC